MPNKYPTKYFKDDRVIEDSAVISHTMEVTAPNGDTFIIKPTPPYYSFAITASKGGTPKALGGRFTSAGRAYAKLEHYLDSVYTNLPTKVTYKKQKEKVEAEVV